jgi:hypothetical protein
MTARERREQTSQGESDFDFLHDVFRWTSSRMKSAEIRRFRRGLFLYGPSGPAWRKEMPDELDWITEWFRYIHDHLRSGEAARLQRLALSDFEYFREAATCGLEFNEMELKTKLRSTEETPSIGRRPTLVPGGTP